MSESIISKILASRRRPTERTSETVDYLFCQQEIINTCKVVMSGYDPDKHVFIDPGDNIQDYYERFLERYEDLGNNQKTHINNLPLTNFRGFTLTERNVGTWNRFKEIEEELGIIKMYVPVDSYVSDQGLLVMAYQLRNMLEDFKKYKEQELIRLNPLKTLINISFDDVTSSVLVNGIKYEAPLNKDKGIKFLRILVDRNGIPASYLVLAKELGMPPSKNYQSKTSTQRYAQDIKNKYVKPALKRLGIPKNEIELIYQSIHLVSRVGYKFAPILP